MLLNKNSNERLDNVSKYKSGASISNLINDFVLDDMIKLSSNESPLEASKLVQKTIKKNLKKLNIYPDADASNLKNKITQYLNVKYQEIIIGAGSNEILVFIALVFMNEKSSVVASKHTFIIYKMLANIMGSEFIEVDTNVDFGHNLNNFKSNIKDNTSVIFICNPNNPTGTLLQEKEITNFLDYVADDILIVFDEAYIEICLDKIPNMLTYLNKKNIIILRSFSKSYSLAGLRIGYGIANTKTISLLEKVRQPFNTSSISQLAASVAIDDQKHIKKLKNIYFLARDYFIDQLTKLNIKFCPTTVNFILIYFDNPEIILKKLLEKNIITRDMKPYGLSNYLRVSFGNMKQNKIFFRELKKILNV